MGVFDELPPDDPLRLKFESRMREKGKTELREALIALGTIRAAKKGFDYEGILQPELVEKAFDEAIQRHIVTINNLVAQVYGV